MKKEYLIIAALTVLIIGFSIYQFSMTAKLQSESNELVSRESDLRERVQAIEKKTQVVDLDEYRSSFEFESTKYNFKFSTPPVYSLLLANEMGSGKQYLFKLNNPDETVKPDQVAFEVKVTKGWTKDLSEYYYMDEKPSDDPPYYTSAGPVDGGTYLGNREALYFASSGYCDAGFCGQPYVAYVTKYNDKLYHLIFYGNTRVDGGEEKILRSFIFTTS